MSFVLDQGSRPDGLRPPGRRHRGPAATRRCWRRAATSASPADATWPPPRARPRHRRAGQRRRIRHARYGRAHGRRAGRRAAPGRHRLPHRRRRRRRRRPVILGLSGQPACPAPARRSTRSPSSAPATPSAAAAWEQAGGYDAKLFFCWEEFDFCLRAIALGWRIRYRGDIVIRHKVSRGTARPLVSGALVLLRPQPALHRAQAGPRPGRRWRPAPLAIC